VEHGLARLCGAGAAVAAVVVAVRHGCDSRLRGLRCKNVCVRCMWLCEEEMAWLGLCGGRGSTYRTGMDGVEKEEAREGGEARWWAEGSFCSLAWKRAKRTGKTRQAMRMVKGVLSLWRLVRCGSGVVVSFQPIHSKHLDLPTCPHPLSLSLTWLSLHYCPPLPSFSLVCPFGKTTYTIIRRFQDIPRKRCHVICSSSHI